MDILRNMVWPVNIAFRAFKHMGDIFPFVLGVLTTLMVVAVTVSASGIFSSYLYLIAGFAYLFGLRIYVITKKATENWEFPYSLLTNVAAAIVCAVAIAAIFFYWPH